MRGTGWHMTTQRGDVVLLLKDSSGSEAQPFARVSSINMFRQPTLHRQCLSPHLEGPSQNICEEAGKTEEMEVGRKNITFSFAPEILAEIRALASRRSCRRFSASCVESWHRLLLSPTDFVRSAATLQDHWTYMLHLAAMQNVEDPQISGI